MILFDLVFERNPKEPPRSVMSLPFDILYRFECRATSIKERSRRTGTAASIRATCPRVWMKRRR